MLGQARIKMVDGRELTVPQYMSYLRTTGQARPVVEKAPQEDWRDGLKDVHTWENVD